MRKEQKNISVTFLLFGENEVICFCFSYCEKLTSGVTGPQKRKKNEDKQNLSQLDTTIQNIYGQVST